MDQALLPLLAAFAVLLIVFALAVRFVLRRVLAHFQGASGGFGRLAQRYATDRAMPDQHLARQTLVVGQVLYRRCATIGWDAAGLHLDLGFPLSALGRRAVLVPWADIIALGPARLFWRKAALLSLGPAGALTITLPMALFDRLRPALDAARPGLPGLADRPG